MSSRIVILIDSVHPMTIPALQEMGYTCMDCHRMSKDEISPLLHDAEGIIVRHRFKLGAPLLDLATKLKWIGRSGVGLDAIDLDYCTSRDITVLNAAGGNADAVGEHVIGMILNLINHMKRADTEVRKGIWRREANRGQELGAMTIGIIGYGHTGRALAQKLSGFGCRVLAHDKYAEVEGPYANPSGLSEIQSQCDLVSFHVPLNAETRHYFDYDFLEQMAKSFYLINASRGAVVDVSAVAHGIRSGKLLGVGLDVLAEEGKDGSDIDYMDENIQFLTRHEKVLFSPHVAGWTRESYEKLAKTLLDRIGSL